MHRIYEYRHLVTEEEIDGLGHVNNVIYLKWLQDAAVEHSSANGWSPRRYREEKIGWVARSHYIEYLQPAFVDQEIIVQTWISTLKKVKSLRKYRIIRPADSELLVRAETNWAFVNYENLTPRRIPEEVFSCFSIISEQEEIH
jgi:acyl-CoA thioester hydrolase